MKTIPNDRGDGCDRRTLMDDEAIGLGMVGCDGVECAICANLVFDDERFGFGESFLLLLCANSLRNTTKPTRNAMMNKPMMIAMIALYGVVFDFGLWAYISGLFVLC